MKGSDRRVGAQRQLVDVLDWLADGYRELVRDPAQDLACDLVREFYLALLFDGDLALEFDCTLRRTLDHDLDHAFALARDLELDPVRAFAWPAFHS